MFAFFSSHEPTLSPALPAVGEFKKAAAAAVPSVRGSRRPAAFPWRALRCTLLAGVCCSLSHSIIRQAHVDLLVSRASALAAEGDAVSARERAREALRQARRLPPSQQAEARRRLSGAEFSLPPAGGETAGDGPSSVTADIARRVATTSRAPGHDKGDSLWVMGAVPR